MGRYRVKVRQGGARVEYVVQTSSRRKAEGGAFSVVINWLAPAITIVAKSLSESGHVLYLIFLEPITKHIPPYYPNKVPDVIVKRWREKVEAKERV